MQYAGRASWLLAKIHLIFKRISFHACMSVFTYCIIIRILSLWLGQLLKWIVLYKIHMNECHKRRHDSSRTYVPVWSKRLCVHLWKEAGTFETSCIYRVVFVFLRWWENSVYLLAMCCTVTETCRSLSEKRNWDRQQQITVLPITGHGGTDGSTLSLTSMLDTVWVVNATSRPLYPARIDPVRVVQEAGWAPGPVWLSVENLSLPPRFDPRTF